MSIHDPREVSGRDHTTSDGRIRLDSGWSLQGSTLAVFRYPEHPRFYDGIPDSPAQ